MSCLKYSVNYCFQVINDFDNQAKEQKKYQRRSCFISTRHCASSLLSTCVELLSDSLVLAIDFGKMTTTPFFSLSFPCSAYCGHGHFMHHTFIHSCICKCVDSMFLPVVISSVYPLFDCHCCLILFAT